MAQTAPVVELRAETLDEFSSYVREAEVVIDGALPRSAPFLWCDLHPQAMQRVRDGQLVAEFWAGSGPAKVHKGLIHDWVGSALMAGTPAHRILALLQDYDNHKNIYSPEVSDSRLLTRQGNDFQIYLRLVKKKIITVVLDTEHEVRYRAVAQARWTCRSRTTRIAEVQDAGTAKEKILPPDSGYGFLWRLNSYWRFEERGEGTYVECRAISLTRDVPFGMGWMIEPVIQKLPRESLVRTLEATRQALHADQANPSCRP
ncbi:MAG TPA: hypothetical protein VFA67_07670 [Candidatus Sulfotelmatobacter sp.]|nr:hypothetical protein [Candidatus Sulfotelmatobacter sp.]